MNEYRNEIDRIDGEMLQLFRERMTLAEKIGAYKRENALPVEDKEREAEIIANQAKNSSEEKLLHLLFELSKTAQKSHFNLYLTGMPFSGKTTLLERLHRTATRVCVDTDVILQDEYGISIRDIFNKYGEAEFRRSESRILRGLAEKGNLIVATGGGILISDENVNIVKNSGYVVLCDRPLEDLCESLQEDISQSRPLTMNKESLELMYFERFRRYRETADLIVQTTDNDAVRRISAFAEEKGIVL